MAKSKTRKVKQRRAHANRPTVTQTKHGFGDVVDRLDAIVAEAPQPGSLMQMVVETGHSPGLPGVIQLTVRQATQCIRASLRLAGTVHDDNYAPVAPVVRTALLAFSKVIGITSSLAIIGDIGPGYQHLHDALVEAVMEHDRFVEFEPEHPRSTTWLSTGRAYAIEQLNGVRKSLNLKPQDPSKRLAQATVNEGAWILEAQRRVTQVREAEGKPTIGPDYRMRWAWHRASVVAHGGFAAELDDHGIWYGPLTADEALSLTNCAVELAAAAQRFLTIVWTETPCGLPRWLGGAYHVPRSQAEQEAAGPFPAIGGCLRTLIEATGAFTTPTGDPIPSPSPHPGRPEQGSGS